VTCLGVQRVVILEDIGYGGLVGGIWDISAYLEILNLDFFNLIDLMA